MSKIQGVSLDGGEGCGIGTGHNTTSFGHSLGDIFSLRVYSAYSTLWFFIAIMRYTNPRFTYLLTCDLLTERGVALHTRNEIYT